MSNPAPNVVVSFSRDALVTFLDKDIQLDKSPEKIDENVFLFKGPDSGLESLVVDFNKTEEGTVFSAELKFVDPQKKFEQKLKQFRLFNEYDSLPLLQLLRTEKDYTKKFEVTEEVRKFTKQDADLNDALGPLKNPTGEKRTVIKTEIDSLFNNKDLFTNKNVFPPSINPVVYLSYGIGPNTDQWAGPYSCKIMQIGFDYDAKKGARRFTVIMAPTLGPMVSEMSTFSYFGRGSFDADSEIINPPAGTFFEFKGSAPLQLGNIDKIVEECIRDYISKTAEISPENVIVLLPGLRQTRKGEFPIRFKEKFEKLQSSFRNRVVQAFKRGENLEDTTILFQSSVQHLMEEELTHSLKRLGFEVEIKFSKTMTNHTLGS